jgi:hypothetical protein
LSWPVGQDKSGRRTGAPRTSRETHWISAALPEEIPVTTTTARQYRDTPIDVKLVLSALWITMLFVFAYVDIFGFYRADVLDAALDGKIATTNSR